jgi:hypothetical protein
MPVVIVLLVLAGLLGAASRLVPRIRTHRREAIAGRVMSRQLRKAVRSENLQRAVAALHEKRDIEIPTLENAMTSRSEMRERIDGVRLRALALRSNQTRNGRAHPRPSMLSQLAAVGEP